MAALFQVDSQSLCVDINIFELTRNDWKLERMTSHKSFEYHACWRRQSFVRELNKMIHISLTRHRHDSEDITSYLYKYTCHVGGRYVLFVCHTICRCSRHGRSCKAVKYTNIYIICVCVCVCVCVCSVCILLCKQMPFRTKQKTKIKHKNVSVIRRQVYTEGKLKQAYLNT